MPLRSDHGCAEMGQESEEDDWTESLRRRPGASLSDRVHQVCCLSEVLDLRLVQSSDM